MCKLWIVTIHGWTITKHEWFVQHYTGSMLCTNSYSIAIEYSAMLWFSNLVYTNSSSSWLATHTLLHSYLLKLCVMWCHYYPVDVCAAGLCVWLCRFVCVRIYVTECIWTKIELFSAFPLKKFCWGYYTTWLWNVNASKVSGRVYVGHMVILEHTLSLPCPCTFFTSSRLRS